MQATENRDKGDSVSMRGDVTPERTHQYDDIHTTEEETTRPGHESGLQRQRGGNKLDKPTSKAGQTHMSYKIE